MSPDSPFNHHCTATYMIRWSIKDSVCLCSRSCIKLGGYISFFVSPVSTHLSFTIFTLSCLQCQNIILFPLFHTYIVPVCVLLFFYALPQAHSGLIIPLFKPNMFLSTGEALQYAKVSIFPTSFFLTAALMNTLPVHMHLVHFMFTVFTSLKWVKLEHINCFPW
jgi:hypothetical protein